MRTWALLCAGLLTMGSSDGTLAGTTSLQMTSDNDDPIGVGRFYFFSTTNAEFVTNWESYDNAVTVLCITPGYADFFNLDFAAPHGQRLEAGTYLSAARYPFQAANQPGLEVWGDGRGCNTDTGS